MRVSAGSWLAAGLVSENTHPDAQLTPHTPDNGSSYKSSTVGFVFSILMAIFTLSLCLASLEVLALGSGLIFVAVSISFMMAQLGLNG